MATSNLEIAGMSLSIVINMYLIRNLVYFLIEYKGNRPSNNRYPFQFFVFCLSRVTRYQSNLLLQFVPFNSCDISHFHKDVEFIGE
ncbi:hypothetical protein Hdeb2414_s0416g00889021 [Helianthus debilis subsp. tardiflorus]